MREAIFILFVLVVVLGLTAFRYRKQIRFALEIWRTMKGVRELQKEVPRNEVNASAASPRGDLVNCGKCGKWVPESTAIKFGPTIYYCSTECLRSRARI